MDQEELENSDHDDCVVGMHSSSNEIGDVDEEDDRIIASPPSLFARRGGMDAEPQHDDRLIAASVVSSPLFSSYPHQRTSPGLFATPFSSSSHSRSRYFSSPEDSTTYITTTSASSSASSLSSRSAAAAAASAAAESLSNASGGSSAGNSRRMGTSLVQPQRQQQQQQPLSPLFARLCLLCTTAVIVMAYSLSLVDQKKYQLQQRHYQETDLRKMRAKKRKLRDYMMENGVEEPIYVPAKVERYLLEHGTDPELLYNTTGDEASNEGMPEGCRIWNEPEVAPEIYHDLQMYKQDLQSYNTAFQSFTRLQYMNISDIRSRLTGDEEEDYVTCQNLELTTTTSQPQHDAKSGSSDMAMAEDGGLLKRFFANSGQLSHTLKCGWIEPLLTPMRHPNFCTTKKGNYLNLEFLVHDYASMCRRLKPTSRVVLFDLGASSKFAGVSSPSLKILHGFLKFGIPIDHIHAFEIEPNKNKQEVYQKLAPRQLQAAQDLHVTYHWVTPGSGVSTEPGHPQNPFTILQNEYNDDDLILVKMDIDVPEIEMQYAQQLLDTPRLWQLVDQFYFEHHVHMAEMKKAWKGGGMKGSILDTLQLFTALRERGIPAHFWV